MRGSLAAFASAAIGLAAARRRLDVPPTVTLPLVSVGPLAVAAAVPHGKWRYLAVGATYMWVFKVSWELPYDKPDRLERRLQVRYPIRFDSLIGAGEPPTLRLQRALRDPPRVTPLDKVVTVVYGSWLVPHLVLGWVLVHHQEFVPRAAARLAAAYHLTTPFYWLVPTAPPWWASENEGQMNGEVERVRRHVLRALRGKPREVREDPEAKGNPWGSMPSDHVASAAITAIALAEMGPLYGVMGWSYVALASFAVVYLGEHYVIDVIAGLAVAEAVRRGEPVVGGEVAVLVGDVAGKGLQTAALSAMARFFIEARTWDSKDPAETLAKASTMLSSRLPDETFVTASFGFFDAGGCLRYANAGHLRPLVLRADGELSEAGGGGLPLGVSSSPEYENHELELGPGDLVLGFTDGLVEARRDGELLGDERLRRMVRTAAEKADDVQELVRLIHRDVREWAGGLSDDVVLLGLRRRGGARL